MCDNYYIDLYEITTHVHQKKSQLEDMRKKFA